MVTNVKREHAESVVISYETVPGGGEDCFARHIDGRGGLMAAFDGCGGMGAKRYEAKGGYSGAYLASHLAAECVEKWYWDRAASAFPDTPSEALGMAEELTGLLAKRFRDCRDTELMPPASRIVSSMQKTLPTTASIAVMRERDESALDCMFLWAGDSRGYVLTDEGLLQVTTDDVQRKYNALENLYRDAPLSNVINADTPFVLNCRVVKVQKPCVVLTATDGAFDYLPTPMEFEFLLLDSIISISSFESLVRRLTRRMKGLAADDCTLLMSFHGYADYDEIKSCFVGRRNALQSAGITPVRRRGQSLDYARGLWMEYRKSYDILERENHGKVTWRL